MVRIANAGQVAHSGMDKTPMSVQVFRESGSCLTKGGLSVPNDNGALDKQEPQLSLQRGENLVRRKRHGAQAHTDGIEHRVGDRRRHDGRGRFPDAPRSFMRAIDEFHLDLGHVRKGQDRVTLPVDAGDVRRAGVAGSAAALAKDGVPGGLAGAGRALLLPAPGADVGPGLHGCGDRVRAVAGEQPRQREARVGHALESSKWGTIGKLRFGC